ncbi:hypothetical protein ABIA32_005404 [Streptacidiphilus sp. MAP12-20]
MRARSAAVVAPLSRFEVILVSSAARYRLRGRNRSSVASARAA